MNEQIELIKKYLASHGLECFEVRAHTETVNVIDGNSEAFLGSDVHDWKKCLFVGHMRSDITCGGNIEITRFFSVNDNVAGWRVIQSAKRQVMTGELIKNDADANYHGFFDQYALMTNMIRVDSLNGFNINFTFEGLLFLCK